MVSAPIPSRSSRRVRVMGTLDWSAGIRQPIRKPLNAALFTLWYSITDEPQSLLTCSRINQGNLHALINSGLSEARTGHISHLRSRDQVCLIEREDNIHPIEIWQHRLSAIRKEALLGTLTLTLFEQSD
jgi:hypothetical protein